MPVAKISVYIPKRRYFSAAQGPTCFGLDKRSLRPIDDQDVEHGVAAVAQDRPISGVQGLPGKFPQAVPIERAG